jgi:hypothetical protein
MGRSRLLPDRRCVVVRLNCTVEVRDSSRELAIWQATLEARDLLSGNCPESQDDRWPKAHQAKFMLFNFLGLTLRFHHENDGLDLRGTSENS